MSDGGITAQLRAALSGRSAVVLILSLLPVVREKVRMRVLPGWRERSANSKKRPSPQPSPWVQGEGERQNPLNATAPLITGEGKFFAGGVRRPLAGATPPATPAASTQKS